MNKKYYIAPATETIGLHAENSLLAGSPEGYKKDITEDYGSEELSNRQDGFGGNIWSDLDE